MTVKNSRLMHSVTAFCFKLFVMIQTCTYL